jgi:phage tail sheath protein FI
MPVVPAISYPGVYVQEVKSDVRTIVPVDTATTAFIGRARRGPVNQPVQCNSYADFQRIFGGLWLESKLGYAVNQFFLNGGSKAIIVRLYHLDGHDKATLTVPGGIYAAAAAVLAAAKKATELDEATGKSVKDAAQKAMWEYKEPGPAQDGAQAILETVNGLDDSATQGDVKTKLEAIKLEEAIKTDAVKQYTLILESKYPGAWGNNLCARITWIDKPKVKEQVARQFGVGEGDLFNVTIHDKASGVTEEFPNVTIVEGPRKLDKVIAQESELVVVSSLSKKCPVAHPPAEKANLWDDPKAYDTVAGDVQADDGEALAADDYLGAEKMGIYALEHADIFNLLYIPPDKPGEDLPGGVLTAAAEYCKLRRAMLLVDPPSTWVKKDDAKEHFPIDGLSGNNAAVYFPNIKVPNPLHDNQVETFGPGGAVAGIFARTDATRGVWKAPAGLEATLKGVVDLSVPLTDAENGELNPLGINCLRKMPAAGYVVWGARTLEGDDRLASQWKYIPVRRTALFVEESLYRNIKWAVFEPNDEPLWSQLRLNIGVFMHGLFRQGAFQGQSPREAYFVKCDKTTTTQGDIDRGIVNIVVGFAPLKPAEFVILYIQQIAGQIQA